MHIEVVIKCKLQCVNGKNSPIVFSVTGLIYAARFSGCRRVMVDYFYRTVLRRLSQFLLKQWDLFFSSSFAIVKRFLSLCPLLFSQLRHSVVGHKRIDYRQQATQ